MRRGFLVKLGFTCRETPDHRIRGWTAADPHAIREECVQPHELGGVACLSRTRVAGAIFFRTTVSIGV
jgi:hypothetical protein